MIWKLLAIAALLGVLHLQDEAVRRDQVATGPDELPPTLAQH